MTTWYLGTVGFSYPDWVGVFYPPHLNQRDYLAHYSQYFNAVEQNSTFYGPPKPAHIARWATAMPNDFQLCFKTPRQITHDLGLNQEAMVLMKSFLAVLTPLGTNLGPVLIQLPPSYTVDQYPTLEAFLAALPRTFHYALEFRHVSWDAVATLDLLVSHNIAWVGADYVHIPRQVHVTADFLYLRWLGEHGRFAYKGKQQRDPTADLQWWQNYLQPYLGQGQTIYGFVNNDYAGYSPGVCNQLKAFLNLPVTHPEILQQGRLF